MTQIKICGLTTQEAIFAVNQLQADYAGFIYFERSPRHLPLLKAASLKALLSPSIKTISVLVDPDDMLLKQVADILKPDFFQLHGQETPTRVSAIKTTYPHIKIIKAIAIKDADDMNAAAHFRATADMLLFDAKPPTSSGVPQSGSTGSRTIKKDPAQSLRASQDDKKPYLPGGNALSFDWKILKGEKLPLPWMLSGGLTPQNVAEAIHISDAPAVDVSSGVESAPGVKDPALIEAFIQAARTKV